jgi:hypothetical protein
MNIFQLAEKIEDDQWRDGKANTDEEATSLVGLHTAAALADCDGNYANDDDDAGKN